MPIDHATEGVAAPPTAILTFHRCINYGSYWQARCLVEGLRALGHDPVLLDHDAFRIRRAEWACGLRPVLPTPVPKRDYLRYGLKIFRFSRAVAALPRSPRFPLDQPDRTDRYSQIVVGSDEVWNLRHPWYGGCPLFFGEGLRAGRLIAHAASFGNYDAAAGLDLAWAEKLRRFEAISVRDENSARLIENTLGLEPERVLDPCLQFSVTPKGAWHGPAFPFVAIYGHNFSCTFARAVRQWARSQGLPLLSLGYRNDWGDLQWLAASPKDFAEAMARAEAVATNFFHGAVFALLNGKPFVCEATPYRANKLRDLMAMLGGERHLATEDTPGRVYDGLLGEPLNPEILGRIQSLRCRSNAWLARALG